MSVLRARRSCGLRAHRSCALRRWVSCAPAASSHLEALAKDKRAARELTGRDRLRVSCAHAAPLLEEMARRGEALRHHTFKLNRLLDRYGPVALERAIAEALERGAPSVGTVAHLCDAHQRRGGQPPALPAVLPDALPDFVVGRHDLGSYDQLTDDDDGAGHADD